MVLVTEPRVFAAAVVSDVVGLATGAAGWVVPVVAGLVGPVVELSTFVAVAGTGVDELVTGATVLLAACVGEEALNAAVVVAGETVLVGLDAAELAVPVTGAVELVMVWVAGPVDEVTVCATGARGFVTGAVTVASVCVAGAALFAVV